MVTRRTLALALCATTLTGCADAAVVGPEARAGITGPQLATYDGSVPYYYSLESVPLEYFGPQVYSKSPVVYWSGATATGSSRMSYYGNRAEETFTLDIHGPISNISRQASGSSIGGIFPDSYVHTTPGFNLMARGTCGHVANLSSLHTAKTVLFIELRGLTEFSVSQPDGDERSQPPCATGCSARKFDQADYDPYEEEDCGEGGGGGGSGGTQYYPGDYTGGETVNWGDGVGNGGTSVCGETAKVEYICIDYWNGQAWQEWSCGYATTC